ncbi:MAG: pilus assembly protein PilM [Planctomycetota bacterium]
MATTGLGVTVGSHSLRAVKLRRKGEGYVVQRVYADRLNDETRPVAGRALAARGFRGQAATVGLTGRDVIIRYSQVPPVPDWRLRTLMKYEVDEVGSQSGGDVSADYRKLDLPDPEGERIDETILVALARNTYLERQIRAVTAGGGSVRGACPNSVALFNAFAVNATYTEDETTLLVNIGAEDLDIAIQQGGELLFARNATPGGATFTEAIQQAFATTPGKAEQLKLAKADVTPRGQARYPDATAEKVANAILGVAGQLASLIQSSLMIARAQTKLPDLKVDRVLLAGGGASLRGLDRYLNQAMSVPVERLDPFAISDLSGLDEEERALAKKAPHEFAVAVGLAQTYVAADAFPLTVLPAALKARREFVQRGVWTVAAAVVAAGILGVLYVERSSAAKEARAPALKVRRARQDVERKDDRFRKALAAEQDTAVKHLVLGEMAAPGALLGKSLRVLQDNVAAMTDVYLQTVRLDVDESNYEFPYYRPKSPQKKASGYEKVNRRRYFRREAVVRVTGRISGVQRPDAIYQDFVQRCQANDQGLFVETVKVFRRGRRDQDGTFEILFRPGMLLPLVNEDGTAAGEITLRDLVLDDAQDPTEISGRRADGVRITMKLDRIERRRRKTLVRDLQARAEASRPADANGGR